MCTYIYIVCTIITQLYIPRKKQQYYLLFSGNIIVPNYFKSYYLIIPIYMQWYLTISI